MALGVGSSTLATPARPKAEEEMNCPPARSAWGWPGVPRARGDEPLGCIGGGHGLELQLQSMARFEGVEGCYQSGGSRPQRNNNSALAQIATPVGPPRYHSNALVPVFGSGIGAA